VAVEAGEFDLIILDLRMPVMDGLTVLQTIRATAKHARTPVVILTADRKEENVYRSINLGVSDYLTKPFRGKEIAERLGQVMSQAAAGVSRS
jgi:two-component system chemotaxis response regulator CheY